MKKKYPGEMPEAYLDLIDKWARVVVGEYSLKKEQREMKHLARKLLSYLDSELSSAAPDVSDAGDRPDEHEAIRHVHTFLNDFVDYIRANNFPDGDYLQNSYLTLTNMGNFFGVDDYIGQYLMRLYKRRKPASRRNNQW